MKGTEVFLWELQAAISWVLLPATRIDRALRFSDFGETLFVILGIFLDGLFDLAEQPAVEFFFRDSIAQKEHCICFAPVLAVFPNLHRIATNFLRDVDQTWVIYVIAVAKKYFVIDGHELNLQIVERPWDRRDFHHVAELMRELGGGEHTAVD